MRAHSWSTISTRKIHRLADSPSLAVALLAGALGARPAAVPLAAQTVSPPVAEYQEKARSSFQLING